MAKHPHRLILQQKKTWRCTLEGCSFFVHLGLAHVLIGKQGVCWGCGDSFTIDELALQDEMPKCIECRSGQAGKPNLQKMADIIERKLALARAGVKDESELTPEQRKMMKSLGILPDDEVEIIDPDEPTS